MCTLERKCGLCQLMDKASALCVSQRVVKHDSSSTSFGVDQLVQLAGTPPHRLLPPHVIIGLLYLTVHSTGRRCRRRRTLRVELGYVALDEIPKFITSEKLVSEKFWYSVHVNLRIPTLANYLILSIGNCGALFHASGTGIVVGREGNTPTPECFSDLFVTYPFHLTSSEENRDRRLKYPSAHA